MAAVAENGHAPVADENAAPVAAAVEQKEQTEKTNGDSVTVFHDPENFTVKHPLMHEWTLWFTKPPSGKVRILAESDTAVGQTTNLSCAIGR